MNVDFDTQWRFCRQIECPCPNHRIPQLLHQNALLDSSDEQAYRALSLSNNKPTSTEITALKSAIATLQARTESVTTTARELRELRQLLSAQVDHIDVTLEGLEAESVKMVDAIAARKLPLDPVRRLPNELLRNIFQHLVSFPCYVSYNEDTTNPAQWCTPDRSESPLWALELVSKGWREALLGDPQIWSIVHIKVSSNNFNPYSCSRTTSQIATHLDRSKQSNLSVTISLSPDFNEDHLPVPFLAFLFPYAVRIRELQLVLPFRLLRDFAYMASRLRGVQCLQLTNACVRPRDATQRATPAPITLFAQCTELRSLVVVDSMNRLMSLDLPWQSLRTFRATHNFVPLFDSVKSPSPRPGQFRHVIDMAKGLEDVSLDLEAFHPQPLAGAPAAIVCARLTKLELVTRSKSEGGNRAIEQLFANVRLPLLDTLLVHSRAADGAVASAAIDASALRAIFGCVTTALRSCHITGLRLNSLQCLFDVFHSRHRLETLILEDVVGCNHPEDEWVHALSIEPFLPLLAPTDAGVLFPELRVLELRGLFDLEDGLALGIAKAVGHLSDHCDLQHFALTLHMRPSSAEEYILLQLMEDTPNFSYTYLDSDS
ncbi:hypothetical protein CYLTODRAFT_444577 [Cylindrobasidium torrendii FP15055 ss-10]|uniref:Uncharacterized protein n=1 Tax=Cylindrobasidium torrendii FP15055 ss-10 TaxID=1314674 RepID=A0A0D7BAQ9_9AGAR|nr:hypothetical protein CYLTODRAFT_444577 [Cylindrobasidium torrendii FP15055 ss-10]